MKEEREYVHRKGTMVSHSIVKGYGPCARCLLKRSCSLRSKRPFLPESKVRHAFTWVRNCATGQTRSRSGCKRPCCSQKCRAEARTPTCLAASPTRNC